MLKTSVQAVLTRAVASGSAAGLTSALIASGGAARAGYGPYAAMNAVTHCLWPNDAPHQTTFSARYTVLGSAVHLGSAVFWGVLFEAIRAWRRPAGLLTPAATTALVAYLVDYHVVPKRVTPGFETHLPKLALRMTYVGLAAGFVLGALIWRDRDR